MTNIHNPSSNAGNSFSCLPPVYIGLPMWQHTQWLRTWFAGLPKEPSQLSHYAKECNTVEGNTTFYSLPHPDAVTRWADSVGPDFSFTFKFNQQITHVHQLQHCDEEVQTQLALLAPLQHKLGMMLVQLPASFGPEKLTILRHFLNTLPQHICVAVEVRHPLFFAKGEAEKAFNQLLIKQRANRVIMDTRALFSGPEDSEVLKDVREKKPRVPVNVIATANKPMVRFIGNDNKADNERCLAPWPEKIHQWRLAGKTPYFFCHRPDNKDAPWLAQQFIDMYNQRFPDTPLPNLSLKQQPSQSHLF